MTTLTQSKPKTRPIVTLAWYAWATAVAASAAVALHLAQGHTVAGWSGPVIAVLWIAAVAIAFTAVKSRKS